MSTEAPEQPGVTASPREPQSCLPAFLRRFFASQTTSVPSGLGSFADKIQQEVTVQQAIKNQQEAERAQAEAIKMATEANERTRAAEEQRKLESQEKITKAAAIEEGSRILLNFQIADRLRIIQQTAWEGKGRIRSIEPDGRYILGGFELAHQYPSYRREEVGDICRGRWRFAPYTDSTGLVIKVLGQKYNYKYHTQFSSSIPKEEVTVEEGRFLEIKSYTTKGLEHTDKGIVIPVDENDSKVLLEEALLENTRVRITNQDLPSQIEKRAREERSKLPHWEKWIHYYNPQYDPSGPD